MTEPLSLSSPVKFLANFFLNSPRTYGHADETAVLVLVCGPSGAGKTTWCRSLYEQTQAQGLTAAGLQSPAVFSGEEKIGIDLWDLCSGERRRLAERHRLVDPQRQTRISKSNLNTENWIFDPQILTWGNAILARMLEDSGPAPQVLFLDELGPLEFIRNQGLTAGFSLIESRRFRLTCVTIRPDLLGLATERWPQARVVHLDRSRVAR